MHLKKCNIDNHDHTHLPLDLEPNSVLKNNQITETNGDENLPNCNPRRSKRIQEKQANHPETTSNN